MNGEAPSSSSKMLATPMGFEPTIGVAAFDQTAENPSAFQADGDKTHIRSPEVRGNASEQIAQDSARPATRHPRRRAAVCGSCKVNPVDSRPHSALCRPCADRITATALEAAKQPEADFDLFSVIARNHSAELPR